MSNYEPPPPPGQPWGTPPADAPPPPPGQPGGQQPPGWGAPPGAPGQPYGAPPYGGQQLPPYGQFGSPQANWAPTAGGQGQLADWGSRAGAFLIDWVIIAVPVIILYILGAAITVFFTVIGWLVALGGGIWFAVQVGQFGQSPGMRVLGLRCINKNTGQTLGAGMGVVRAICHIVDSIICYIGYLWPLWDETSKL